MAIIGIVAEYNPLHNGHRYHIEAAKEMAGADGVVCVMGGNWLQRGEPALVNKWARARMALLAGVDLVFELPTAYATRSANWFAQGAISLLTAAGVVTHLAFGSELGKLAPLEEIARVLVAEPAPFRIHLQKGLDQGLAFPLARGLALQHYFELHPPASGRSPAELAETLRRPNNILAVEYIKEVIRQKSPLVPLTIARRGGEFHQVSTENTNGLASATAIRRLITRHWNGQRLNPEVWDELANLLPSTSIGVLQGEFAAGRGPVLDEALSPLILAHLRRTNPADLGRTVEMSEGLENRLIIESQRSGSLDDLLIKLKTKRYSYTRLKRLLLHTLMGFSGDLADSFAATGPAYLRVLGLNQRGQALLQVMKQLATRPVITRLPRPWPPREAGPLEKMLVLDVLAGDLYTLLYPNPKERLGRPDLRHSPVVL